MFYIIFIGAIGLCITLIDLIFKKTWSKRDSWLLVLSLSLFGIGILQKCNSDEPTKSDIKKLSEQLNPDPVKSTSQGFTIYMVLTQKEVTDNRRKYIFDFGESTYKNRISLYFDASNNLMFSVLNTNGEPNTCTVPVSLYTITPNIPFFVYMDCGTSPTGSYMRIRINDRDVYQTKSQFEMDYIDKSFFDTTRLSMLGLRRMPKPDFYTDKLFFSPDKKGMVCADLNGQNIGKFDMFEIMAFGRLLQKDAIDKIWGDVIHKALPFAKRYIEMKLLPMNAPYQIINGDFVALPK